MLANYAVYVKVNEDLRLCQHLERKYMYTICCGGIVLLHDGAIFI